MSKSLSLISALICTLIWGTTFIAQDTGMDTIDANNQLGFDSDLRHYDIAAQMLLDLGIKKIRLLTNNPKKVVGLTGLGVEIVDRVEIEVPPNDENLDYLETKKTRMGHFLGSCS